MNSPALPVILPWLQRTPEDDRPIVVMTCGISGSGKSTLAHSITRVLPSFTRLSNDQYIHEQHGLYGIDYDVDRYSTLQDEAALLVQIELSRLLHTERTRNIVLDLSFYSREYRDEYRQLINEGRGRAVLVYFQASSKDALWARVQARRRARDELDVADARRNGDSAYDVTEEVFDMYWDGFEAPEGEEEIVITV